MLRLLAVAFIPMLVCIFVGCGSARTGSSSASSEPEPRASHSAALPQSGANDAANELKRFQGSWSVTAAEQNGVATNKDELAEVHWVCEGDKLTLKLGTEVAEYKISLDASKDPKAIDSLNTGGSHKGETAKGIYRFIDDELIICFPTDTKGPRPKEFTGKAGSDQVLQTLKRRQG